MSPELAKLEELLNHFLVRIPHGVTLNFSILPRDTTIAMSQNARLALARKEFTFRQLRFSIEAWLEHSGRLIFANEVRTITHPTRQWPDHVTSPIILAWCIHSHKLPLFAQFMIMFDHGDTPSTFMLTKSATLIDMIVQQLMMDDLEVVVPQAHIYADDAHDTCNHD